MNRPSLQSLHFSDFIDQKGQDELGFLAFIDMNYPAILLEEYFCYFSCNKYAWILFVVFGGNIIPFHFVIECGFSNFQLFYGLDDVAVVFFQGVDDKIFFNFCYH
jgi:hypothetical protein